MSGPRCRSGCEALETRHVARLATYVPPRAASLVRRRANRWRCDRRKTAASQPQDRLKVLRIKLLREGSDLVRFVGYIAEIMDAAFDIILG